MWENEEQDSSGSEYEYGSEAYWRNLAENSDSRGLPIKPTGEEFDKDLEEFSQYFPTKVKLKSASNTVIGKTGAYMSFPVQPKVEVEIIQDEPKLISQNEVNPDNQVYNPHITIWGVQNLKKKVNKYGLDGKYIQTYESASEAGRLNKGSKHSVTNCCKGKNGTRSGLGFIWRFTSDEFPIGQDINPMDRISNPTINSPSVNTRRRRTSHKAVENSQELDLNQILQNLDLKEKELTDKIKSLDQLNIKMKRVNELQEEFDKKMQQARSLGLS